MPSRSKSDLNSILSVAYDRAVDKYQKLYPSSPQPFITCTHRSDEEQEELFKKRPKVTNARAGQSPHNYKPSYAFDIAFISLSKKLDWSPALFSNFAEIIKKIDSRVEWGGDWSRFKDAPHFELRGWRMLI
jgi:peptidoglycan L-alanyl-D-glutamate endopeptidase CwlK